MARRRELHQGPAPSRGSLPWARPYRGSSCPREGGSFVLSLSDASPCARDRTLGPGAVSTHSHTLPLAPPSSPETSLGPSLALSFFLSSLSWKSCLFSVLLPCHRFTPCGLAPRCPHPRDFPCQGPHGLRDPNSLRCLT